MYNYEAIETVYNQITKEPETFDMNVWCGTAQCLAGWVCYFFDSNNYQERMKHENPNHDDDYFISTASKILKMQLGDTELFFETNYVARRVLERLLLQKDYPLSKQKTIEQML